MDIGGGNSVFHGANSSVKLRPRGSDGGTNGNAAMTPELIVINEAGIPCIPRNLFHRIVDGILPVKEMEMLLLAKVACFLATIAFVLMLLGFFDNLKTSLKSERSLAFGETAMGACFMLLPLIFATMRENGKSALEIIRRRFIVRRLIENYLKENEFFYAY